MTERDLLKKSAGKAVGATIAILGLAALSYGGYELFVTQPAIEQAAMSAPECEGYRPGKRYYDIDLDGRNLLGKASSYSELTSSENSKLLDCYFKARAKANELDYGSRNAVGILAMIIGGGTLAIMVSRKILK